MKNLNPLLADLIKAFSYDYVFAPNSENVKLDLDSIAEIYNIINKYLFSSKLNIPFIKFEDAYAGTEHLAGYNYRYILLKDQSSYTLITKSIVLNGKILVPPQILLNPILSDNVNLMLFVNALAHEMIHQDDIENGTYLQRKYDAKINGKSFNGHDGYFNEIAVCANREFMLDIKERGLGMEKEIQKSLAAVRHALLEKAHKEAEMLSEENKTLNLTDKEILKRSKVGIESDDYSDCKYLGNGIFEETLF